MCVWRKVTTLDLCEAAPFCERKLLSPSCSNLLVAYLWGHALALAITDPRKKGVGWQTVGLRDDGARARDARRVALGDIARRAARVTAFLTNGPPVLDREYHRALRWWEGRRHCYLYLRSVGPLSDGSGDPELDVREAVLGL
jgi:hypothetical protein